MTVTDSTPGVDVPKKALNMSIASSADVTGASGDTREGSSSPNVANSKASTPTSLIKRPMSSGNVSG